MGKMQSGRQPVGAFTMFSVWTPVRVSAEAENQERAGQAGLVWKVSPKHPEHVVVKWDDDETQESILMSDIEAL